jgi:hypothetical protein
MRSGQGFLSDVFFDGFYFSRGKHLVIPAQPKWRPAVLPSWVAVFFEQVWGIPAVRFVTSEQCIGVSK